MKANLIFTFCISLLLWFSGFAQNRDLRTQHKELQQRAVYFNNWLKSENLHTTFKVDSVRVLAHKAVIHVGPAKTMTCDSLELAFDLLEVQRFHTTGNFFHDAMLEKWREIGKLANTEAEVQIGCKNPPEFAVRIMDDAKKQAAKPKSEFTEKGIARQVSVTVPNKQVQLKNTTDNSTVITNMRAEKACEKGLNFCRKWYKEGDKGTWFFDTEFVEELAVEREFTVRVTYIKDEICPDGYFELHHIHATFEQQGADVAVRMKFDGKYGSGIIFAPRLNGYKDMNPTYKSELENYQRNFFKYFIQAITKL